MATITIGFVSGFAGGDGLTHQASNALCSIALTSTKEAAKVATKELLLSIGKASAVALCGTILKNLII